MPNPMVGAVVVHNDTIIGEGFHERYGEPHAEVHAIQSVQDKSLLKEATIYVTLEPCSHFGKTPPCADLLISSGIRHVVVGCKDPNPKVAGTGIKKLQDAGIRVTEHVRERECIMLNRRFILFHTQQRPYIILKWAETADHFIAREDGSSKWISSEFSRRTTHRWRAHEMGILVGTTTARVDDPHLTVRHVEGINPLRLVIDTKETLLPSLALFNNEADTWIFTHRDERQIGTTRWRHVSPNAPLLPQICEHLRANKILSVIVEGGAKTLGSFIESGFWDEARVFQSQKRFESGIRAPILNIPGHTTMPSGRDRIEVFQHPALAQRLGITDSSILRLPEDLL
jgi:diaminohydroxyphosphoribosylaminopyrimidine deaminase/5-amino-6-(5-phosphoribosylamino)uracil reductase